MSVISLERIKQENDFIQKLINTIPAKFYFNYDVCSKINEAKQQRMEEKISDLGRPGQKRKAISTKSLHKRAKLDPGEHLTVTRVLQDEDSDTETAREKVSQPSIDKIEARQKLQEKINELRGNRLQKDQASKIEARKLKRRLSKKRLKQKRKLEKQVVTNGGLSPKEAKQPTKPTFNKEETMVFNKFDFEEFPQSDKKRKGTALKDYKQLLTKVMKDKEKMQALKADNPEKAKSLEENQAWAKMLHKVKGEKVKDDPKLLKKSLKKKEQRKKKTLKEWKNRDSQVEEKIEKRQKKRMANLKKKKDEKVKNKVKKATKKGRYIPI